MFYQLNFSFNIQVGWFSSCLFMRIHRIMKKANEEIKITILLFFCYRSHFFQQVLNLATNNVSSISHEQFHQIFIK